MPAPTQFTTAQLDADSPWNETTATLIKTTFDHILDYAANYINDDLVDQGAILAASVGQGELKTGTDEQSTSASGAGSWVLLTFTATEYAFRASVKSSGTNTTSYRHMEAVAATTSYRQVISIMWTGGAATGYAKLRTISASPPHKLDGIDEWPYFLFLLRHRTSGVVIRASLCSDPPHYYEAQERGLPKNHLAGWLMRPHPFDVVTDEEYAIGGGTRDDFEVVLIDLREKGMVPAIADRRSIVLDNLRTIRPELVKKGMNEAYLLKVEAECEAEIQSRPATSKDLVAGSALELSFLHGRMQGEWNLETAAKLPETIDATRDVAATEDGKFLGTVPGLFTKGMDGSPPMVRVVCCP